MPKEKRTAAKREGQIDFETRDLHDDAIELLIAEQIAIKEKSRPAHKEYNQASGELKKLLPMDSVETPTRIKIASSIHGNWIVTITPRDRSERQGIPAGVSKYVKIEAA